MPLCAAVGSQMGEQEDAHFVQTTKQIKRAISFALSPPFCTPADHREWFGFAERAPVHIGFISTSKRSLTDGGVREMERWGVWIHSRGVLLSLFPEACASWIAQPNIRNRSPTNVPDDVYCLDSAPLVCEGVPDVGKGQLNQQENILVLWKKS